MAVLMKQNYRLEQDDMEEDGDAYPGGYADQDIQDVLG